MRALRGGGLGRGLEGRRNSRNQGSEERLTWWRGFCDCYFCPPLNEEGLGAVGAGRKEKRPTPSWRSSGRGALVQVPTFASPAPSRTQSGATLFSLRSLGPSRGPGASAWTVVFPGVGGGVPMARPPPSAPPLSCSTGSSDPYCIVKVDNEPIIRYRPRPAPPTPPAPPPTPTSKGV